MNKVFSLVLCLLSFNVLADWQVTDDMKGVIGDPVETPAEGAKLDPYVFIPFDYPTSLAFALFYDTPNPPMDCSSTPSTVRTHLTNGKYVVYKISCVPSGYVMMPRTVEGHEFIINELRTKNKVTVGSFIVTTNGFNEALSKLRIIM